jgi:nucleoside-diphosphate-sugar epimerase
VNTGKRVLVTGANGFIGREVCRQLRAMGRGVVGIDVKGPDTSSELLACDITDRDAVSKLFNEHGVGEVIHLAALLPSASQAQPWLAAKVNILGSANLLESATHSGVRRFVFASSMSVYRTPPKPVPVSEDEDSAPGDLYGAAKHCVELLGKAARAKSGIEFVALRIATVVGPGAKSPTSSWRSDIFEALGAKAQRAITIPFGPDALLSLVHVEDVARMLITLGEHEAPASDAYNTPAQHWQLRRLKEVIEMYDPNVTIQLTPSMADAVPPLADGSRFTREFGYASSDLALRLADTFREKVTQSG